MATTSKLMTAEELFEHPDLEKHCELVRGELITTSPAGNLHGETSTEQGRQLANHVKAHKLGKACGSETGYIIGRDPDTVLASDASFIARDRLPPRSKRAAFLELVPDLVAEVVSPSDRFSRVEAKARMWLAAGCKMVLVVDPQTNTVRRYTAPDRIDVFDEHTNVDCSAAVPSWTLDVAELFEE